MHDYIYQGGQMTIGSAYHIVFTIIWICCCLFTGTLSAQDRWKSSWPVSRVYAEIAQDDSSEIIGQSIRISGVANISTGILHERYLQSFIQDTTGGISIFADEIDQHFNTGDSLVVTGRIQQYFGLVEIRVDSYEVFPDAGREIIPAPLHRAISSPDANMGVLVSGEGVITEKGTRYNGKYLRVAENDTSSSSIMVYVSNFHKNYKDFDFDTPVIGDKVQVTGILAEYDPDYPGSRTFHLMPRNPSEVKLTGFPRYYMMLSLLGLTGIFLIIICWVMLLKSKVRSKTEEIRKALQDKDILLREIHHRVKNNLAIVAGLLDLQMDNSQNSEVHRVLQDGRNRIQSMALIHEKLYNTESLTEIALHLYLRELTEAIFDTYSTDQKKIDLHFDMDEVWVSPDLAIPCGLLLNELVTNAFKHAFNEARKNLLTIELKQNDEMIILTVADNGPGLPANLSPMESGSLGMMLVQTFKEQLSAEMYTENKDGAKFRFKFRSNEE